MTLEAANKLMYLLGFVALSGALNLLLWPAACRWLGLCSGGLALALAVLFGWQLVSVGGGWFALEQKLAFLASGAVEPVVERSLPALLAAALLPLVDLLIFNAQRSLPGLALHLGAGLMFLGAYLALKVLLVALSWGWQWWVAPTCPPPALPRRVPVAVNAGLALVGAVLATQPYLPVLALHSSLLYALGVWILLLELRQWLTGFSLRPVYT